MKTDTFFNIESMRTYFGYEGFRYVESSEFNTAINQLENEMYYTFRSVAAILESIETHKEAKIISNKLKTLHEETSEFTPTEKQKLYLELIDYYESSTSLFDKHLKSKYFKGGKKTLPLPVRYWIFKAIEASKKEFNSYEPFQAYMLKAYENYFGYEIKRKMFDYEIFNPDPKLWTYYYFPNIPKAKQPDGNWIKSLKQTLQMNSNFNLVSTVILESQAERKYKLYCIKNDITYSPPRDIAAYDRLYKIATKENFEQDQQLELFPINEIEIMSMFELAAPLILHHAKQNKKQKSTKEVKDSEN